MYNNTLYDQHIHSEFSNDGERGLSIPVICETAIKLGLKGVAVTDHLEPFWPDENDPSDLDVPSYEAALMEYESVYRDRIKLAKAVEVGLLPGENNEICDQIVNDYPYDFVIGSVHFSEAYPIEYPGFLEGRTIEEILDNYYTLIIESIKEYKNYDVLGHINCIDRYTDGFAPTDLYMPYVEEILRIAIGDGKGIEVNTSAFRYGIGDRGTPTRPILDLYKDLGGEIITIGSDAHKAADIGTFIKEGEEILLATGFRYIAVFSERRPEFVKI